MTHLDDDRIVNLASGAEDPEGEVHLRSCEVCSARLATWRAALAGLRELAAAPVGASELHRLRSMYRVLGPARDTGASWLARLVRSTSPAAVAVRGAAAAELVELEAGPYTVLVQVTPVGGEGAAIHGQVLGPDEANGDTGRLVLVRDDGEAHVQELDELGEFHVEPVQPGRWRATWWIGEGRIDLDELRVGGGSDA